MMDKSLTLEIFFRPDEHIVARRHDDDPDRLTHLFDAYGEKYRRETYVPASLLDEARELISSMMLVQMGHQEPQQNELVDAAHAFLSKTRRD